MGFARGPRTPAQWAEALSGELTAEKAERLKRGRVKRKFDRAALAEQIAGCVADNLNAALALFTEGCEDPIENVYRLKTLTDTVHRVSFFKELAFLGGQERERLDKIVREAVADFIGKIELSVENENADILFWLSALEAAAEIKKSG